MKKQTNPNWRKQLVFVAIATMVFMFAANSIALAQGKVQPAETTKPNKFGTRDPRTCANTKAPARGVITAALAIQYFICQKEKVSGSYLDLVENVKIEIGGGRPYSRTDQGFSDVNVKVPLYPIRGSFKQYTCEVEDPNYNVSKPGQNCTTWEKRKATGYCYKTTFGDWRCDMTDIHVADDDFHSRVAPPPK